MANHGKTSDGKTKDFVAPAGGVIGGNFYRIGGINLIAETSAAAGETFAGYIDNEYVYRFEIPSGVAAAAGATLYIPTGGANKDDLTATSSGNVPACFVVEAKDGNNRVEAKIRNW